MAVRCKIYLVRDDEEGRFLTLHLEDDGLQPCDYVQVAFPSGVAIAELILLASGVLLGEARFHLYRHRTSTTHRRHLCAKKDKSPRVFSTVLCLSSTHHDGRGTQFACITLSPDFHVKTVWGKGRTTRNIPPPPARIKLLRAHG